MIYLDTSALVKLVIEEAESETLEHWLLLRDEPVVTSVIGRVELLRACRRIDPASTASANLLLADLPLIPLAGRVLETAENIGLPTSRSLDALHLAAAFDLGGALTSFVAYDKHLRDAAVLSGLPVMTPSMA